MALSKIFASARASLTAPRLARIELACAIVVCAAIAVLITIFRLNSLEMRMADNVGYEHLLNTIRMTGGMRSDLFTSVLKIIESRAMEMTSRDYVNLVRDYDINDQRDILRFHTYFILYLVAPFTAVASATKILAATTGIAFAAVVAIAYVWLRRAGVGLLAAAAFTIIVMLHPGWGVAVFGQFYPDRFFIPLALAFAIAIHLRWLTTALIVGLIAILITERAPSVLGLFLAGYGICFYRPGQARKAAIIVTSGLALIALGSVLQSLFITNLHYSAFLPQSPNELLLRLLNRDKRGQLWVLLAVNAGLLVLACFQPRTLPIVASMLVPNAIGDVGGAEKTGFLTHYHSYYFPILIWAAGLGYIQLLALIRAFVVRKGLNSLSSSAIALAVCVTIAMPGFVDWSNFRRIKLSWKFASDTNVTLRAPSLWRESYGKEWTYFRQARRQTREMFQSAAIVSAPENVLWAAPLSARVFMFPVAMDRATHLGVVCNAAKPTEWTGVHTFASGDGRTEIEHAFRERARSLGFDVDNPQCGPLNIGYVSKAASATK